MILIQLSMYNAKVLGIHKLQIKIYSLYEKNIKYRLTYMSGRLYSKSFCSIFVCI